jgi:hypothetical protein
VPLSEWERLAGEAGAQGASGGDGGEEEEDEQKHAAPAGADDAQAGGAAAPPPLDVFLSHSWGDDAEGRDNHARVAQINTLLQARGLTTWFDEQGNMSGNTLQAMTAGIDRARVVLVFVTRAYVNKCNKEGNDNCKLEFEYAYYRKSVARLVPVVMEPGCGNPASWDGPVGAALASKLYVGMQDDGAVGRNIDALVAEVRRVQGGGGGGEYGGFGGGGDAGGGGAAATAPPAPPAMEPAAAERLGGAGAEEAKAADAPRTADVVALEAAAAEDAVAAVEAHAAHEAQLAAMAAMPSTTEGTTATTTTTAGGGGGGGGGGAAAADSGSEIALPEGLYVPHGLIRRVRKLGRGGFGAVWLAMVQGMPRALKEIEGPRGQERGLTMEALALAQVHHEHVVRIMGFCTDPGHRCLLMEVAAMGSLRDVLSARPGLAMWRRFALLRGAEKAMWHLHTFRPGRPMVHSDLKPANLLVCDGWVCKVADFGLAHGVASAHRTAQQGLTACYAPPEVLRNRAATTASDVFSYGMTVWETVTGRPPWQEMRSRDAMLTAILAGERPEIPAGCDEHFVALLPRCWAHDEAKRISFERICALSEAAAPRFEGAAAQLLQRHAPPAPPAQAHE